MKTTGGKKEAHQKKDKLLQVRLDRKTLRELDEYAMLLGVSRSVAVRKGIAILAASITTSNEHKETSVQSEMASHTKPWNPMKSVQTKPLPTKTVYLSEQKKKKRAWEP